MEPIDDKNRHMQSESFERAESLKLPNDLIHLILSILDEMDIEQTTQVSKLWSLTSIEVVKNQAFSPIKTFVYWFVKLAGNRYPDQQKKLLEAIEGAKILNSVGLLEIKYSLNDLREKILNILKELDNDDLDDLRYAYYNFIESNKDLKPFEKPFPFHIAECYKQLDKIAELTDEEDKNSQLYTLVSNLSKYGQYDKALEVSNNISEDTTKEFSVSLIITDLIKENKINKAIEIIKILNNNDYITSKATEVLVDFDKFDQAMELAKKIKDNHLKQTTLENLAEKLRNKGQHKEMIDIYDNLAALDSTIIFSSEKQYLFWHILDFLTENDQIEKALEVAFTLFKGLMKTSSFDSDNDKKIDKWFDDITKIGLFEKVTELAKTTTNFTEKYPAFAKLLGALLNYKEGVDSEINYKTDKLIKLLPASTLYEIAICLSDDDQVNEAINVAKRINDPHLKESALSQIVGDDPSCTLF